jgi:hypothetical protein
MSKWSAREIEVEAVGGEEEKGRGLASYTKETLQKLPAMSGRARGKNQFPGKTVGSIGRECGLLRRGRDRIGPHWDPCLVLGP